MTKKNLLLTAAIAVAGMLGAGGAAHAQTSTAPTATPPPAPTVTTRWAGAPETREEDRRFRVNGHLMYDIASTDADYSSAGGAAFESGIRSYFRRAFLGVEGRLTEQWRYNVKFDFAVSGTVTLDDAYLEYAGPDYSFIVGNNNAVSAMEDRDSSLAIPFNERSLLIGAAGWAKRPGVGFIANGGNWSLGAALQSNDAANTSDTASNGTESYFFAGRGTWAPIYQNTPEGVTLLHLAASARQRDNGSGNGNALNGLFSYAPTALSNKAGNTVSSVGAADSDLWLGAEMAFQWHAFGMEAEYGNMSTNDSSLNTTQTGDADVAGYYVDLFWSPTGESRAYRAADGSFGNVRPFRTLGSDGGIGHVMLSARHEQLDLSDGGFTNGALASDRRQEVTASTLGATWVPVEHVKFQLNYSTTDVDYVVDDAAHLDNTIDAVTLRTQLDW